MLQRSSRASARSPLKYALIITAFCVVTAVVVISVCIIQQHQRDIHHIQLQLDQLHDNLQSTYVTLTRYGPDIDFEEIHFDDQFERIQQINNEIQTKTLSDSILSKIDEINGIISQIDGFMRKIADEKPSFRIFGRADEALQRKFERKIHYLHRPR